MTRLKMLMVCTLVLSLGRLARADSITVNNFSFEDPAVPSGSFTVGVITDWTTTGISGVFNPITPGQFDYVPDGLQVGYSNGGSISQVLAATLQPNTVYTLTVYVGRRTDFPDPFSYGIELWAGDVLLNSDTDSVTPDPGSFNAVTVQYTSSDSDPGLGQPLKIVLSGTGSIQTAFDNVQLDGSPF
jgi:hypothetical protein